MSACAYATPSFSTHQVPSIPSGGDELAPSWGSEELTPAQEFVLSRDADVWKSVYRAAANCACEGTNAPSFDVFGAVARLIAVLPPDLPAAEEVYFSDLGCLNFDWDEDPENQLSIMLPDEKSIAFAALIAGDRVYGTVQFSTRLPEEVAASVRKWINNFTARNLSSVP